MGIFNRKLKRHAKDAGKFISALAAATFFTLPSLGYAQNITKADAANATTIISNGNVHEIYADEYSSRNAAINHFSNFELDAKNIANMHFGQQGGASADTLINLVDSRADINGIVNAVKDGTIGGNLYFISSQGIAVGAEGVINAGKIGLIAPTDSYYQNLVENKGNLSADNFSADKIRNGEIPLNVTGSISVAGKLNATDGINLAATNIDITNGAQLQSVRTINYSDFVNVSDEVSAGLDPSNLTVTKNDAGEIVIAAAIDSKNLGMEDNFLDNLGLNYTRLAASNSANVNIADGAKIHSDGNVDIRALANSDIDIDLGKTTAVGTFLSLQSNVNVDGEVTGDNVNISAQTTDNYKFNAAVTGDEDHAIDLDVDENTPMDQTLIGIFDGAKTFLNVPTLLHKLHISAAFVGHNNSADVKIGDKAVITATGTDSDNPALNISSAGIFNADLQASNVINGSLPALGFTFSYSGNTAGVDVGGKLNAQKGSLAVTSNADTDFSSNSTIDATQRSGGAVTLVTNLLLNGQESNVNIGSNAELNAAENISVNSISNSPTNVVAEVKNDSGGLGALSVNYVSQTDDAKINTDAKITAGGNVEIKAEKTAPTYKVLSNIATDKPDLLSQVQEYTGNIVKNIVDGATKRANEKNSNDNSAANENTGSYITTNANIAIETSNANVNVGKNSAINADGNVSVTSKVNFGDPEVGALNVSSSDFVGQQDTVAISPAVNFIKSTNVSSVIFEGDTEITGNDINIKSEFESNNVRFAKARQDLIDSADEIKNIFSAKNLAEKSEVATNFFQSLTDLSAADVAAFVTQGADISSTLNDLRAKLDEKTKFLDEYQQKINSAANSVQAEKLLQDVGAKYPNVDLNELKDSLFKNAEDLLNGGDASKVTAKIDALKDSFNQEIQTIQTAITRVDTICDTAKVANYYADKEQVSGKKSSDSTQSGLALAGTVNVDILNNSTKLLIGKNTSIDAEQNVDIATDLKNIDMAVSGHIKPQTSAASALNLIVNAYIANDDNILAIAENSEVNAKNISVGGKNYVNHILFADGSGQAPDSRSRASGTVNYGGGESLTLVSVDDESKFNTDGKVDVTAENNANLLNIAGGLAYSNGAANAGASIAINNFNVQTLGAISNNDISETSELFALIHEKVDAENIFGSKDVAIDGKISAENLKVNANSDGAINSLSIAGSLSTNGDSDNSNKNGSSSDAADDTSTAETDLGANIPDFYRIIAYVQKYFELDDNAADSDNVQSENSSVLTNSIRKIDKSQKSDKGSTTPTQTTEKSPVKNEKPSEVNTPKANEMVDSKSMPSFTISGAGSASVNLASNRTVAEIEVKNVDVKSEIESKAIDDTFIGAWSGAGALNFRNYKASDSAKSQSASSTNVDMAGAVGLNIIDANVNSQIKNTSSTFYNKVKELEERRSKLETELSYAKSVREKTYAIYSHGLSQFNREPALKALSNIISRVEILESELQENALAIQSAKENQPSSTTVLSNTAEKSGAIIAAAPSLAIQHNSGESANNYSGAASVSINIVENNVDAEILNSNIDAKSLTNTAQNNDTQVTGGINIATATGGSRGIALGGSVALAHIQNNVDANIDGGTFNINDSFKNISTGSVTQVVGAVGVSVANGSSSSYGFQGVFGYNRADNKNYATISNANITANDIENISADNKDATKKFDSFLTSAGIDATGQSYADEASITNADSSQNASKQQTSNAGTVENFDADKSAEKTKTTNYGNKVITGAFALAGAGDGAAMASIAISDVDNDFVSTINGGSIKTNSTDEDAVKISAVSNTLDINAAAGAAISSKGFGAGGSVSWQTTDNNVVAGIGSAENNSDATTLENVSGVDIDAETGALEVNVAGQLSGGKGTALGLAMAYNALNDTTDAFIKNVSSTSNGTEIAINSASNGSVYAVGAGVGVSANSAAIGGSIAINRGSNSTLAEIEDSNISNAKNILVDAKDNVNKLSVVGNLQISGGSAAVGGAVAYNDIGASTSDKQKTSASILNSNISNGENTSINVNALDESALTTIGVGVGIAGKGAAVQGAVAVATINKDVDAKVSGSTINIAGKPKISAQSTEDITTSADVLSVNAGTGAAIGAGVAINNDKTNTLAELNTSTVNSNGLEISSSNKSGIVNVGIGASGGSTGAAVTGSVAVNNIGTKTLTNVNDSTIDSSGVENVLIDSQSDELISNYAGSISFAGTGAAVGVSVSVNNITSETASNVNGGTITLRRLNDDYKKVSLKNYISPDSIADKSFVEIFTGSGEKVGSGQVDSKGNKVNSNSTSETSEKVSGIFKAKSGLEQQRENTNYRGIVINSSGTHTLQSLMINGGAAGTGAAVNGTVNINLIDGKTAANVDGTKLNTTNENDDINIIANDYTKSRGVVGSANAALVGAAVGLGNDSQDVARKVDASYIGRNDNDVSTNNFNIQANNLQGMNSLIAGISLAVEGAGVSNSTGVYLMEGSTNAALEKANVTTNNLNMDSYHNAQINTLGAAVGIAGLGAGVGLGVDVLREVDLTTANIKNSTVNFTSKNSTAFINAFNNTTLNYEVYDIGAGAAGLAGAIGVSNVMNEVAANIEGSNLGANGTTPSVIYVSGTNYLDFGNKAFAGAAGLGGIGAGISVTTIDGKVNANVDNSALKATNLNIDANEIRNVKQTSGSMSAGVGAISTNVMVTSVGAELESSYRNESNSADDGSNVNIDENIGKANKGTSENNSAIDKIGDGENNPTKSLGINAPTVTATKGGSSDSGVSMTINNSQLIGDAINISNQADNNVEVTGSTSSIGGVALGGGVGILNFNRNSALNITNSSIDAQKSLEVKNIDGGRSALNTYQGSAGAIALNVSYSKLKSAGVDNLNISGSNLKAVENIIIENSDVSNTEVNAVGIAAGLGAGGVLIAEGDVTSNNKISIDNATTLTSTNGSINVASYSGNGDNSLKLETISKSGGWVFAGAGIVAVGKGNSTSQIDIGNNTSINAANDIYISANNNFGVETKTSADSTSLLSSNSATILNNIMGSAENPVGAKVNIGDGSTFNADNVFIESVVSPAQNLNMTSLSVGAASKGISGANFNLFTDNQISIGNVNFKDDSNVMVTNYTSPTQKASVAGLNIGLIAAGTQQLTANRNFNASTTMNGTNSEPAEMHIFSQINSAPNFNVDGNGGGVVDISPYAGILKDNLSMNSNVDLNGKWTPKTLSVFNENIDGGTLNLNAARAAVIGASAVMLNRTENSNATINFAGGTEISTEGSQTYTAKNTLALTEDLQASGYGGATANAAILGNDLKDNSPSYSTQINIGDGGNTAKFSSSDDNAGIYFDAKTAGKSNYNNTLNATGVVSAVIALTVNNTEFKNAVNVNNAQISTLGNNADITLAASDNTNLQFAAAANLNAGLGGVASSNAYNTFTRSNYVNLKKAILDSGRDINLFTDTDSDNLSGNLNLSILSDAYNKTTIPLSTRPSLTNSMTQTNQIDIDANSNLISLRNINLQSTEGQSEIIESAREYNTYTGISGKGSIVSTSLGDVTNPSENRNNFVNIDGTLRAGKNNELDILIANDGDNNDPQNIKSKITISKGSDILSLDSIKANEVVTIENPYLEEYNKTVAAMQAYPANTDESKSLKAYADSIAELMVSYGFAEKQSAGVYNIFENIQMNAIDIPDLALSGGDINISTSTLKGSGSLTARSALGAKIQNETPSPIRINDISMENAGGYAKLNGNILTNNGYQFKTLDTDGNANSRPNLEITHTGKKLDPLTPNVLVEGTIDNSTGKVIINNSNGSVIVLGNINAGGGLEVTSPNGGFMLNDSKATYSLTDPMIMFTFGNQNVADILQKFLIEGINSKSNRVFNSYDDYLNIIFRRLDNATKTATGGSTDLNTWKAKIKKDYGPQSNTDEPRGSIVSSGPITIIAKDINVNGLIQSGFLNYNGTVDTSKVSEINSKATEGAKNLQSAFENFKFSLLNGITSSVLDSNTKSVLEKMSSATSYEDLNNVMQSYGITDLNNYFKNLIENYTHQLILLKNSPSSSSSSGFPTGMGNSGIGSMIGIPTIFRNDPVRNMENLISSLQTMSTRSQKLLSYANNLNYNASIKDAQVIGNESYLVNTNTSGKSWNNSTKMYDGVVNIYYNPSNKHFLTENLNVGNGGIVSLKGNILSTGNGRIVAAKGAANIDIDTSNATGDLYLGAINNTERLGNVIIEDTSTNNGRQTFNSNGNYTPTNGKAYAWTGGVDYTTTWAKTLITEAQLWGAWDLDNDTKFRTYVQNNPDKVSAQMTSTTDGKTMANGVFVTVNNDLAKSLKNNPNLIIYTSTDFKNTTNTQMSPRVITTNYSGIFWAHKTTTARWTEKQGRTATSTYFIPADKAISIEIPSLNNGKADVNITSNGSIYTTQGINNPASNGKVALNSTNGQITSMEDFPIISKEVALTANSGINANVNGVNNQLTLTAETNNGTIEIMTGSNVNLGTIEIKNTDKKSNPMFLLDATGNIEGGTINAPQINLISDKGGITNVTTNLVNGVETPLPIERSLNASAQNNIILTSNKGDMRIGYIESKGGDVTLTANDGNILDVTEQTYELSDSEDRLQRWIDMGIVNSDDSDDSNEKSAAAQKSTVIESLEQRAKVLATNSENPEERLKLYADLAQKFAESNEMQNAKTLYTYAVKNSNDINQKATTNIADATQIYNDAVNSTSTYNRNSDTLRADYFNRIKNFFAGTNLTQEEMELVSAYAWANSSNAYGFSKNQLLYAIQDGILNSTPGQTVNVDKANIIGNTVSLTSKGGIGNDDETAQTINAADLSKLENLQLLSTLKAGDLTWNKNGDAIIRRQHPISLEIKKTDSDNLSVSADKQIYLVGTQNTTFNLKTFNHNEDYNIRLMTGNGIFNNATTIAAKDLIVYGGKGSVGTQENPLRVNLTGSLDANSGDSIYISSVDNKLTIQSISANNDVNLKSKKDIVMTTETGKTGGYISGKTISFDVEKNASISKYNIEGVIGEKNNGVRIFSNAKTFDSAPKISLNANGAIINGIGNGVWYFDNIDTPYGFGFNLPSRAGYKDAFFKDRSSEISTIYKNGILGKILNSSTRATN